MSVADTRRPVPRSLLTLLLLPLGFAAFGSAQAATFYVRTDGGDASQCTGKSNAAYPGSGTAQACAWKHPYYALPTSGTPRIAGGDTLMIGQGEYQIGYGAPGASCTSGDRTGCNLGNIPSGPSASQPTRIVGDSAKPPKLWGTGGTVIITINGRNNIELSSLEITDKDACVERHGNSAYACTATANWASTGIYAYNAKSVALRDVNIHGLGHTGLNAGKLVDWTLERVKINRNGWAGWDSNVGSDGSNTGNFVLRNIEVAYNGCGETRTTGEAFNCWAHQTGGYGDGIGLNTTAGTWLVEDAFVHHNTSDGLDFLYLDGAPTTSATFRRVYSVANAGNQIKTTGNTLIENSVVVGQCAFFAGKMSMTAGDQCRASGNAISVTPSANTTVTIRHNTITGQGDGLILNREGAATAKLFITNNALLGNQDYLSALSGWPDDLTFAHYAYNSSAQVTFAGNLVWNVKGGQCPTGSICNTDPKVKSLVLASFDGTPQAGSPLLDKVPVLSDVRTDFLLQPRPAGSAADIGAYELQAGGTTPPPVDPTPTCTRAAPTVSLSGPTAAVAAGTAVTYNVSVKNNDSSACATTGFALARTVASGWTGTLSATSLSLAPGASGTATLNVTSPATATAGGYGVGLGVSSGAGSVHTGSASATYTVQAPVATGITETIATDKSVYTRGSVVSMNARVLKNGTPVNGATVKFVTTKPNGVTITKTLKTGSDGYARWSFTSGTGKSSIGQYKLVGTATSGTSTATANTSFTVN